MGVCAYMDATILGACFMAVYFHAHQTKTTATCTQAVSIDGDMLKKISDIFTDHHWHVHVLLQDIQN